MDFLLPREPLGYDFVNLLLGKQVFSIYSLWPVSLVDFFEIVGLQFLFDVVLSDMNPQGFKDCQQFIHAKSAPVLGQSADYSVYSPSAERNRTGGQFNVVTRFGRKETT